MKFDMALLFCGLSILSCACASKKTSASTEAAAPKRVSVAATKSVLKQVPAAFEETGSFVADESSDIAPPVAGRVIATPVNVGAFVKEGQVICELDHRDAELKLEQVRGAISGGDGGGAAGAVADRAGRGKVR